MSTLPERLVLRDMLEREPKSVIELRRLYDYLAELNDYACIFTQATGGVRTLGNVGVFSQIIDFTANGPANLSTPSHGDDHITVSATGAYRVSFSVSYNVPAASGGNTYHIHAELNNGATELLNLATQRKLSAGGDTGVVAVTGLADLTAGDTVELWIAALSGAAGREYQIEALNLNVQRIA